MFDHDTFRNQHFFQTITRISINKKGNKIQSSESSKPPKTTGTKSTAFILDESTKQTLQYTCYLGFFTTPTPKSCSHLAPMKSAAALQILEPNNTGQRIIISRLDIFISSSPSSGLQATPKVVVLPRSLQHAASLNDRRTIFYCLLQIFFRQTSPANR